MMARKRVSRKEVEGEIKKLVKKTTENGLETVGDITVDFAEGSFEFGERLAVMLPNLVVMFIIAMIIIFTRVIVVDFADVIYVFAKIISVTFGLLIDGLNVVLDAVDFIGSIFGSNPHLHIPKQTIESLLGGDWVNGLRHIPSGCKNYTTWEPVLGWFLGFLTQNNVCVFLRYISPAPVIFDIFDPLLDWMTYDPLPAPEGGNCETTSGDAICAWLGLGYVIRDLLIPAAILLTAASSYKKLLWRVWHIIEHAVLFFLSFLVHLLSGAYTTFEDVKLHFQKFKYAYLLTRWRRHVHRHGKPL